MPAMTDTPPEIAAMVRRRLMARRGAERFIMGAPGSSEYFTFFL
jgi:hypothetical protein